jgi:hypothetical protein
MKYFEKVLLKKKDKEKITKRAQKKILVFFGWLSERDGRLSEEDGRLSEGDGRLSEGRWMAKRGGWVCKWGEMAS